ncbi:MAG: hypothetical protein AB7C98_02745 [Acidithiobacillus sp.]
MGMNESAIRAKLDACLLTDAEMQMGKEGWRTLPDPFSRWEQEILEEVG